MPGKQTKKKKKLTVKQIAELEEKAKTADEYLSQLKRLAAEFDNYKKRMAREQSSAISMASKNLIIKLLPIIDDLERALKSIEDDQNEKIISDGVRLTHADIKKLLTAEGVEEIKPDKGTEFDPCQHEAVANVSCELDENCVVEVMQKGYMLGGQIVRPAMVTVSCSSEDQDS